MQRKKKHIFLYTTSFCFLLLLFPNCSRQVKNDIGAGKDWPVYLGDNYSSHYSGLSEISKENIGKLTVAWEYHTGDDVSGNRSQIQCNPIIIDGILYGTSPNLKVFALDAATGKELWNYDPDSLRNSAPNVNRGVAFWKDGKDKRILFTYGEFLYCLDAKTGFPVMTFGDSGKVSLKEGLGDKSNDLYVAATSPGIIYNDLLIIGSRVSEGVESAPGHIRAFNVRTGEMEWVFHTIPHPGESGYDTWPADAWKTAGGANSWAGMSLDKQRGIVYVPTGSAAFDFWGGNRKGANLFANCILALDASTGKRIWHFQTVHHDIWDRDLPAPPNLLTVTHGGRKIDALAQITKTGFIYLLDRETGFPLFPVEERTVPGSDLEGEETWPTQPFPTSPPPFIPQTFKREDITYINSESRKYVSGIMAGLRTGEMFIPPSVQGTLIFPGFDGGGEWGGAAIDPLNSILYVNGNIMPWIHEMSGLNTKNSNAPAGEPLYRIYCAVCHGIDLQGDPSGTYPPIKQVTKRISRDEILALINNGKGMMPSFKNISEKDKLTILTFISEMDKPGESITEEIKMKKNQVPYTFKGYNRFLDKEGYPAIKPPWGNLSAIDLNKGEILWQVPLGEFPELTAKGIPVTGTENYGGPSVTAGGIIFIGASKDGFFRAFDKDTGMELWKYKLPAGGYATPAIYEAGGRQYVVIACGGGKMGTHSGDSYLAFSLKNN